MNKRTMVVVAVGAAMLLATGGLIASNMGFKLNYSLLQSGTQSGTNTLGLPFNKMTGLINAKDLIDDINNTGVPAGGVTNVQQWDIAADSTIVYDGASGVAFNLDDGSAVFVKVSADTQYVVVGSHNPGLVLNLSAGGQSGTNLAAVPYHTTAGNANDLINEVNGVVAGSVTNAQKWDVTADSPIVYDGASGAAFNWVAGEGVFLKVNQNVAWVPSHF